MRDRWGRRFDTQALQRAPSVEMKAARHQQRRENGVLVRRRKVEREQAWIASKVEDITRRERAAAELLYQRQNKRLLARQRNVLTKVAIASLGIARNRVITRGFIDPDFQ